MSVVFKDMLWFKDGKLLNTFFEPLIGARFEGAAILANLANWASLRESSKSMSS